MSGHGSHHSKGHKLMMLMCCVIAIAAAGYYFLGGRSGQISPGFVLMLLLCPLMHFFMMGSHGHSHGNHDSHEDGKAQKDEENIADKNYTK